MLITGALSRNPTYSGKQYTAEQYGPGWYGANAGQRRVVLLQKCPELLTNNLPTYRFTPVSTSPLSIDTPPSDHYRHDLLAFSKEHIRGFAQNPNKGLAQEEFLSMHHLGKKDLKTYMKMIQAQMTFILTLTKYSFADHFKNKVALHNADTPDAETEQNILLDDHAARKQMINQAIVEDINDHGGVDNYVADMMADVKQAVSSITVPDNIAAKFHSSRARLATMFETVDRNRDGFVDTREFAALTRLKDGLFQYGKKYCPEIFNRPLVIHTIENNDYKMEGLVCQELGGSANVDASALLEGKVSPKKESYTADLLSSSDEEVRADFGRALDDILKNDLPA